MAATPVQGASIELVEAALEGKIRAIARLLTRVENGGEEVMEALGAIYPHTGKAHIIGITGVPGSGKSTLMALLARQILLSGRRAGIVAVDPTSPFSGGAILGDRIRMNELGDDPGIFIRSMATRGMLGGLARTTLDCVDILDAAGYDAVLIETVGVGQDEIDVVRAAHTTVVVSAPGLGDDIQAIKAGVLEIADVHVVSKCDRADSNRTIADLKNMLRMSIAPTSWQQPVVATSAASGAGVDQLLEKIDAHLGFLKKSGELCRRQQQIAEQRLLQAAEELLRGQFQQQRQDRVKDLVEGLMAREIHPHQAAKKLIDNLWKEIRR